MSACGSTQNGGCGTEGARRKKPEWLRLKLPTSPVYQSTTDLVRAGQLHTVCESAHCPNRWECWSRGTATFMVAGDRCTRNCGFCAVNTAKPLPLESDEPDRVGAATAALKLRHVVVTMVARDDLADGASAHVADCVRAIRRQSPATIVEVLTSDFLGKHADVDRVLASKPDIFAHNLETVERTTPRVRSRATYARSLDVLRHAGHQASDVVSKSGLMLGIGETDEEVRIALKDLRDRGVQVLTLGQYLQPSPQHLPVERWVTPAEFDVWREEALALGFASVASGPLVRSSYYADAVNMEALRGHMKFAPTPA